MLNEPIPGVYQNVPYEEYDRWDAIRKSTLWPLVRKTPMHYRYAVDHPDRREADELLVGHAGHAAALEQEMFKATYVVRPQTYHSDKDGYDKPFNLNSKKCKQMLADIQEQGKIVLKKEQFRQACGIRDAIHAHKYSARLLQGAQVEVSMLWIDPKTGLVCKLRMDVYKPPIGGDIKTCREASPALFGRSAYSLGYHFQGAMYQEGVKVLGIEPITQFIFIAVESEPPHGVRLYDLDEDAMMIGRAQYRGALDTVAQCTKHGTWPGYDEQPDALVLPPWAGTELQDYNVPWDEGDEL